MPLVPVIPRGLLRRIRDATLTHEDHSALPACALRLRHPGAWRFSVPMRRQRRDIMPQHTLDLSQTPHGLVAPKGRLNFLFVQLRSRPLRQEFGKRAETRGSMSLAGTMAEAGARHRQGPEDGAK